MSRTTEIVRTGTRVFCGLVLVAVVIALAACSTAGALDDTVGVSADDNAIQCIHANADGYFTDSAVLTNRMEFPKELDLGTLTPELVVALTELAEKMGCTQ